MKVWLKGKRELDSVFGRSNLNNEIEHYVKNSDAYMNISDSK